LRPLTEADRDRLLQILEEPDVARWWRRDEWERIVEEDATTFVIELAASGMRATSSAVAPAAWVIGMIQFDEESDADYRHAAIDLFLSAQVHGRGLGAEAIRILVRYLIDERGHRRFTIDPAVENRRAVRCYTKVGFRPVGVMRQYERVENGIYRDALLMDLLARELTEHPVVGGDEDGLGEGGP
jgi:aminoglycoside 6'-N-acetyltransferase